MNKLFAHPSNAIETACKMRTKTHITWNLIIKFATIIIINSNNTSDDHLKDTHNIKCHVVDIKFINILLFSASWPSSSIIIKCSYLWATWNRTLVNMYELMFRKLAKNTHRNSNCFMTQTICASIMIECIQTISKWRINLCINLNEMRQKKITELSIHSLI